jgi:uncharacterized protein YjbI with pentapeptide repeats
MEEDGMTDNPANQQKSLKEALAERWKRPIGLVTRARIVALLQTREICSEAIRDLLVSVQLPDVPSPKGDPLDLRGIQLLGVDLCRCIARADFTGAVLDGSNLGGADLLGCRFSGASLRNVQAKGALLGGAEAIMAVFDGSDLEGAILSGSKLLGASFQGANLEGALLDSSRIAQADFRGARLAKANFQRTAIDAALFDHPMPEGIRR